MSDIAQILLLPPPQPLHQRLPGSSAGREQELAVNAEAQGGDAARAKRFRFRVHEGGETGETGTELTTRRSTNATFSNDGSADSTSDSYSYPRPIRYATSDSHPGNSSAFLAQAFAQEQLGEGLHNPPFAAASAAYSRTGASLSVRPTGGVNLSV